MDFNIICSDGIQNAQEKEFLTDIAHQNFTKYGIHITANVTNSLNNYNKKGHLFIVNHRNMNDMLAAATAAITDIWFEKPFLKSQIIVHQPYYDQIVKGKNFGNPRFLFIVYPYK